MTVMYEPRNWRLLFRTRGAVIYRSIGPGLLSAFVVTLLKLFDVGADGHYDHLPDGILPDYHSYFAHQLLTFLLGFVITFRCEQAVRRYWEARTALEFMTSKWSIAAMQSVVFDNYKAEETSHRSVAEHVAYRYRILSLYSLLHATALTTVSSSPQTLPVFRGVCRAQALRHLQEARTDQVFTCFTWVSNTLIKHLMAGGLGVPPPICTRVFQISNTPFPFPYAQQITLALLMFCFTTAIVANALLNSIMFAMLFSFVCVWCYCAVNEVAVELENPFGQGINDFPIGLFQQKFNSRLETLLHLEKQLAAPEGCATSLDGKRLEHTGLHSWLNNCKDSEVESSTQELLPQRHSNNRASAMQRCIQCHIEFGPLAMLSQRFRCINCHGCFCKNCIMQTDKKQVYLCRECAEGDLFSNEDGVMYPRPHSRSRSDGPHQTKTVMAIEIAVQRSLEDFNQTLERLDLI